MSEQGCRRCLTQKTLITTTGNEIRRIARRMADPRTTPARMATLKEQLALAKAALASCKAEAAREHEHDTRLTDEHWTKAGRIA